jgi:hypothetical protein
MSLLTPVEREAINDSMLKIQSIQSSLDQIEEGKVPDMEEIHECLRTAHRNLRSVLKSHPGSGRS